MKYIVWSIFLLLVAYGYLANILFLITRDETFGLSIARAVGIFIAPLGTVLGFF